MESKTIDNLVALAARAMASGKYDDASTILEGLLTIVNHGEAWMGLAAIAQKRGEPDLALQYLSQAHQASPKHAIIRLALAEALLAKGETGKAKEHLRVLQHHPDQGPKAQALLSAHRL